MHIRTDIVVIGASLGGVMAAYQACRTGHKLVLVSEFDWLGGQMTSQGVPPDEHQLIETGGATQSYLQFRQSIRQRYLDSADFQDNSEMTEGCNPGDGWVSRLCFEPSLAAAYFEDLLAPFVNSGSLHIMRNTTLVSAQRVERQISSVVLRNQAGELSEVDASWYLDASDTGALLKAANLAYRLGKEAQSEFSEVDAPETANSLDQQPVTYVMALRLAKDTKDAVSDPAPADYAFWKSHVLPQYHYPQFSLNIPGRGRGVAVQLPIFGSGKVLDLWRYRRIICAHNWKTERSEVSLVNWAQNDFALHPLLDGPLAEHEVVLAARSLSLCWLHWLQTEAPRSNGAKGYPNLELAKDLLGTTDGLAQQVYVRESRRIVGRDCLTQNDIVAAPDVPLTPIKRNDSVGLVWYNMDIHPTCISGHGANARVRPFCIPLGCFIPLDCDNLIPACKNISVTHLVSAATRVHPSEWLIGEVAGLLASFALSDGVPLDQLADDAERFAQFRERLLAAGIPLEWTPELMEKINENSH